MTRHAAASGENGASGNNAAEIFGRRLIPHQDHVLAAVGALFGGVGIEDGAAARRTRTRRQSCAQRRGANRRIDDRMQQLIELASGHATHRFDFVDQSFAHHVAGDLYRGSRSSFSGARLQQIEPAALDRELEILHVAVVLLQPFLGAHQLLVGAGQLLGHPIDV